LRLKNRSFWNSKTSVFKVVCETQKPWFAWVFTRDVNFDAFLWYWRAKDSKFLKASFIERFDQAHGLALRALRLTGTSSWPGCSHPRRKFTCSHVPFCFRIERSSLVCELCVLLKWCLGDLWKTWVPLDLSTSSFPSQIIVLCATLRFLTVKFIPYCMCLVSDL